MELKNPNGWKEHLEQIEDTAKKGIRAYPTVSALTVASNFTMHNCAANAMLKQPACAAAISGT